MIGASPVLSGPHGPLVCVYIRGHAYGHIGLDLLMASAYAKQHGADLCILRPPDVVADFVFRVQVDGVTRRDDPETVRVALDWWDHNPAQEAIATRYPAHYFQRRLIRQPIPARFDADPGIEGPLACIQARWRHGPADKIRPNRDSRTRNARMETYHDAVDVLLGRGLTVVRMGDPSMPPLRRRGVVDLAGDPDSGLRQLACLFRARLLLCSESGPAAMSLLTNTPCLVANATDPISSYPVRADGRLLLKRISDRVTGDPVDPLSAQHVFQIRDTTRWRYEDNTSADLADAVTDLLADLDAPTPETPAHARWRDRTAAYAGAWERVPYVRKWGQDAGFIGDGRACRQNIDDFA